MNCGVILHHLHFQLGFQLGFHLRFIFVFIFFQLNQESRIENQESSSSFIHIIPVSSIYQPYQFHPYHTSFHPYLSHTNFIHICISHISFIHICLGGLARVNRRVRIDSAYVTHFCDSFCDSIPVM